MLVGRSSEVLQYGFGSATTPATTTETMVMGCCGNARSRQRIAYAGASALLLALLTTQAAAQVFSAGIKAGTPLSAAGVTAALQSRAGFGPSTLNVRRYTVRPSVELALPFRLRLEADVLYKRLDRTEHRFGFGTGTISRIAANTWEFPMLLKYAWTYRGARPFALAGGTFRRMNSFDRSEEIFFQSLGPLPSVFRTRQEEALTQGGWVIGSGVRFDFGMLKLSPEIRYTRWTSQRLFPTQNQVEFLFGVMF